MENEKSGIHFTTFPEKLFAFARANRSAMSVNDWFSPEKKRERKLEVFFRTSGGIFFVKSKK